VQNGRRLSRLFAETCCRRCARMILTTAARATLGTTSMRRSTSPGWCLRTPGIQSSRVAMRECSVYTATRRSSWNSIQPYRIGTSSAGILRHHSPPAAAMDRPDVHRLPALFDVHPSEPSRPVDSASHGLASGFASAPPICGQLDVTVSAAPTPWRIECCFSATYCKSWCPPCSMVRVSSR
jgi:hypothetical protein